MCSIYANETVSKLIYIQLQDTDIYSKKILSDEGYGIIITSINPRSIRESSYLLVTSYSLQGPVLVFFFNSL